MNSDHSQFAELFGTVPLMAIMRGMEKERGLWVAKTAWDIGIEAVEVTIQSESDLETLRAVAAAGRERGKVVGAGTIISKEQVAAAKQAGARFTVSPGLDVEVVRASLRAGLPPLPGVHTATEIQCALKEGLHWMKAFPASVLGASWFKAMHGPFPQVTFVATGGMHADNARQFLDAGARVVAVGSALEDESQLEKLGALFETD